MGTGKGQTINRGTEMISAIITCAGNHSRFGKNKLLADLGGKPVFIRTLEQFSQAKSIDEIIVVIRQSDYKTYKKAIQKERIKAKLINGGLQRYVSAFNGIRACQGKYILVHDGARPLTPVKLINKIAREVKKNKAVMAAIETHTCIKQVKNNCVEKCLPRETTWLGQTPQAFKREIILAAYQKAIDNKELNGMDDCELVSSLGIRVKIVAGDIMNLKITVPSDLIIARHFFKKLKKGKNV